MKKTLRPLSSIIVAGGVLLFTSMLAVVLNAWMHGFHMDYTISRYVGLETWSAILFGLGNIAVTYLSWKFLMWMQREGNLPKWLMWGLAILFAVGLLGLSACPAGYFDTPGEAYGSSWPSFVHNRCARVMFMSMLLIVAVFAVWTKLDRIMRIVTILYIAYGMFCAAVYFMGARWFSGFILVFESCYIFGFFGVCLGCGRNVERDKGIKEDNGGAKTKK